MKVLEHKYLQDKLEKSMENLGMIFEIMSIMYEDELDEDTVSRMISDVRNRLETIDCLFEKMASYVDAIKLSSELRKRGINSISLKSKIVGDYIINTFEEDFSEDDKKIALDFILRIPSDIWEKHTRKMNRMQGDLMLIEISELTFNGIKIRREVYIYAK